MGVLGKVVKSPFQPQLHTDSFAFCLQAHLVMKAQLCDRRARVLLCIHRVCKEISVV